MHYFHILSSVGASPPDPTGVPSLDPTGGLWSAYPNLPTPGQKKSWQSVKVYALAKAVLISFTTKIETKFAHLICRPLEKNPAGARASCDEDPASTATCKSSSAAVSEDEYVVNYYDMPHQRSASSNFFSRAEDHQRLRPIAVQTACCSSSGWITRLLWMGKARREKRRWVAP